MRSRRREYDWTELLIRHNISNLNFLIACTLFCLLLTSRETTAQMTPDETRLAATVALTSGNYEEAIIHLGQLVEWYKDSEQKTIVAVLGEVYYNLGLSHLLVGAFQPAEQTFLTYMKRYPHGPYADQVAVLIGDVRRYQRAFDKALKAYEEASTRYGLTNDLYVDCNVGIARCHLAEDRWAPAIPALIQVYRRAPDFTRRNWAATMLAISYLRERKPEMLYPIMTVLLQPESFTSRSVAYNMVALEVADEFFAEEHYRQALWIYRLVYPYDVISLNSTLHEERLNNQLLRVRSNPRNPRPILRIQESLGDIEAEMEALSKVENYDAMLQFRVARAYMEVLRYREARDLFHQIHKDGQEEFSEQALYLALVCASRTFPLETTIEIGKTYMKDYPNGTYYDEASVLLGQVYVGQKDWTNTLSTLSEALSVHPEHSYISECLFMLGYASFMEEQFTDSVNWLQRLNREFPNNDRYIDAEYWIAMAFLFDKKFEEAIPHFLTVIENDPEGPYHEDASFRYASCEYGLSHFEETEQLLLNFLQQYPESKLAGESYVMLGDIAGTFGDPLTALARFRRVPQFGEQVNIELYNHASFRMGEMLNDLGEYEEMIRHFKEYIERAREGSNIPQALYWIGHAYWQQDERDRALAFYLASIEKYGTNRMELGIDLILEDWVGKVSALPPASQEEAWRNLGRLHDKAMRDHQISLAMRLKRIMMYDPNLSDGEKNNIRLSLLNRRLIEHASMSNLQFMMGEAIKLGDQDLALVVAQEIIAVFPETDAGMEARLLLARDLLAHDKPDEALLHLTIIREQFPGSDLAAQALIAIGRLHAVAGRHEESDQAYQDLLGVREWRSYWPEALYGRGENARAAREYERASAFYERIYVLYSGSEDWTAKAYLARAECLQEMNEIQKATEVLDEFLAQHTLEGLPEYATAKTLLQRLRRRL